MTPNRIIEHIFHVPNLHQVDETALNKLVTEYPYFATARVLLAKKDYSRNEDLNSPAVKTGSLYSHQAHHFYQFVTAEAVLMPVEERIAPVIPADTLPEPAVVTVSATDETITRISEPPAVEEQPVLAMPAAEEAAAELEILDPTVHLQQDTVTDQEVEEEVAEDMAILDPTAHLEATHDSAETQTAPVTAQEAAVTNGAIPQADLNNFETTAVPEATDVSPEPIKIFPLEIPTEEATELVFQPLYTDDYFAYKRLKDPEHADELSAQGAAEMKSFTSWLRQMKDNFVGKTSKDWYQQQLHRLYEEEEEPEVSETVEKMALDSIRVDTDIVSETLAEIWVRQHQYQNAIQIYQKLSLLNPDKNAYFAQKIKELKSLTDKK